jgi:hypothetical protein
MSSLRSYNAAAVQHVELAVGWSFKDLLGALEPPGLVTLGRPAATVSTLTGPRVV